MKVNPTKLEIAIAQSGMTIREIQTIGKLSNVTINRARYQPEKLNLTTVGKIARTLGVPVTDIIEGVSHEPRIS